MRIGDFILIISQNEVIPYHLLLICLCSLRVPDTTSEDAVSNIRNVTE